MCGIFGIYGHPGAAALTRLGLYALQHRGQESAGIVAVNDDGQARVSRSMGLVADAFPAGEITRLDGSIAIGHTRYSTAGTSVIENAQPVLAQAKAGHIALAHNGNLPNARELRQALEADGAIFSGTMDSEVVVHRIARSHAASPEARVVEALQGVDAAYALLILIDKTLIAVRDPYGFRPLVMGKLGDVWVFASETCALDIAGAEYVREVEPGEVLALNDSGMRSSRLSVKAPLSRCIFEHVYFARPDSDLFGSNVSETRHRLGRQLAKEQPAPGADIVFAVPDSANGSALGFAAESRIPFELALIRNHYVGRTFIDPTQQERDAKVKIKFNPVRELIEGKSVVMVDDSIVRGTTTRGLVALIRRAGAREIHMRVSSPPVVSPCYYGVDMPDKNQLIATRMPHDEMVHHLGVDSLGYLSTEGMLEAMADGKSGYCYACFSGRYPTEIPEGAVAGLPGR